MLSNLVNKQLSIRLCSKQLNKPYLIFNYLFKAELITKKLDIILFEVFINFSNGSFSNKENIVASSGFIN